MGDNMKGKKTDNEFISSFIADCCSEGKFSINEFICEANRQIKDIEEKIIEVEKLKKRRLKLADVIFAFTKQAPGKINGIF